MSLTNQCCEGREIGVVQRQDVSHAVRSQSGCDARVVGALPRSSGRCDDLEPRPERVGGLWQNPDQGHKLIDLLARRGRRPPQPVHVGRASGDNPEFDHQLSRNERAAEPRQVSLVTLIQASLLAIALVLVGIVVVMKLRTPEPPAPVASAFAGDGGDFRPGGFGRGMPAGPEKKVVAQFDRDGDERLDEGERREARAWLEGQAAQNGGIQPVFPMERAPEKSSQ